MNSAEGDPVEAAVRFMACSYGMELSCAGYYANCLAACSKWDLTKRVYLFTPELGEALVDQAAALTEKDELPLDALNRLPCKAFYMKAPNVIADGIDGCFVWLDESGEQALLRMVFLLNDMRRFVSVPVRLLPEAPLKDCLPDAQKLAYDNLLAAARGCPGALELSLDRIPAYTPWRSVSHNLALRAVQLALYLAAENADVPDEPEDGMTYPVGLSLTEKLKGTDLSGNYGKSVRAHIRKGHYHKFWKGPRKGPRRLVIHWVEPMVVGGKDGVGVSDISIVSLTAPND